MSLTRSQMSLENPLNTTSQYAIAKAGVILQIT